MISTATVSPSARPSPSIDAATAPLRPNGSTVIRTTSHLVAPSACAASMCGLGVCRKTSRDTEVMMGRTITANTTPAVSMLPPPANETLPTLNRNSHPRWRLRSASIGSSCGASTKIPHSPNTIDGTAASRSTIAPNGRASLGGAYWVRNTAMPIAIGTAKAIAHSELSSVTMNRSRMPNASFALSTVLNCALVKKFAWLARSAGIALTRRNIAISPITMVIVEAARPATDLNRRSPARALAPSPALRGGAVAVDMTALDQAMALTAVDSPDLNASGIGMYPLSAKPFWPGPMVACRNALTAVPTWLSEYFEQTTSYVANTIG